MARHERCPDRGPPRQYVPARDRAPLTPHHRRRMQPPAQEGLVLRIDAKACHVEVDGVRHLLPFAGKLFEQSSHEKRPFAVGDRVVVRLDAAGGAIDAVRPRTSQLHRRATSEGAERAEVIAANVTLVLAVAAVAEPPFQAGLVDGLLAAAQRQRLPAALVLTKTDLDRDDGARRWADLYRGIGLRVWTTSTAAAHRTTAAL